MTVMELLHCCFRAKVLTRKLSAMAQSRKFRDVVEIHEKGKTANPVSASGVVGYCYYQLGDFEKACVYLKKKLSFSPSDYPANFFLAVCLKALNRKSESLLQFLDCLKLHTDHATEILDQLLPLAYELEGTQQFQKVFEQITRVVEKLGAANSNLAKVLFYQGREAEIPAESFKEELRFCRFYSAKELTDLGYGKYLSLGTPEKLRFVHLENNSDVWVDTCPPYVAEIRDAKIVSGSSLIFIGENKILSEVLADKDFGHFANMDYDATVVARRKDALLIKNFEPQTEIPEMILLCGVASNAYGHWFAEFLPKLRFFEKHPRFSQIPILIDEGMPQSHYDFLAALVNNPIHRLAKGDCLKINNLLVAPADTFFPADMVQHHKVPVERQSSLTVGALRYLGDKIKARYGEPNKPTKRFFFSRRNSQWRRLLNENAIIENLKELNFETVYIEDFSFEEQVKIFQSAEFVVAPNGSALNNLAFSNPSTKVLMLGQRKLFNWGGWFGSFMELGFSPQYLADTSVADNNEKHLDYEIPVLTIRKKVQEMLQR